MSRVQRTGNAVCRELDFFNSQYLVRGWRPRCCSRKSPSTEWECVCGCVYVTTINNVVFCCKFHWLPYIEGSVIVKVALSINCFKYHCGICKSVILLLISSNTLLLKVLIIYYFRFVLFYKLAQLQI